MNGVTKILLIGGGLAAFYAMRKYADKKFAASGGDGSTFASGAAQIIKDLLPEDIIPETKPIPVQVNTPVPVTTAIESTTPVFTTSPTVTKSTVLVQPKLTIQPLTTFDKKLYSLDQRALDLSGCNLR